MKKKFKDTKVGKLLSKVAPNIIEVVGDVLPPVKMLSSLISNDPSISEEDRYKALELIKTYELEMEANITERWSLDMGSDSWLSKNVRPLVLLFLVVSTVLLVFIDAGSINFNVESKWTDLLQLVLITVITAYFGGRSFEKRNK